MQGPERAVEYYMYNNNELPNKETTFQIKRHSDHIKPTCSVIAMWEVKLYTHALRTPFDLMAKRTGDGESGLPQKRLRCQNPSPFRGEATFAAGISDGSIDFLKRRQSTTTYSVGAAFLAQVHFQPGSLCGV